MLKFTPDIKGISSLKIQVTSTSGKSSFEKSESPSGSI